MCRVVTGLFVLAWVAGVALFFVAENTGIFALDIMTALVMTPLGLPWNLTPVLTGGSETTRLAIALGAPALNVVIVWGLCKAVARRFCPAGC